MYAQIYFPITGNSDNDKAVTNNGRIYNSQRQGQ